MKIRDHFEAVRDPGFRRGVDSETARQQLNMSFGLVVLLAIVAAGIALSFHFEPSTLEAQMKAPVKLVVQAPQPVHVQQAEQNRKRLPGG